MHNPIICAIDTTDSDRALALAQSLKGSVGAIKLGLEFFMAHGADGVRRITSAEMPIFLDLKFHDIPNTVGKAIKALRGLDVFMLTVHASGGAAMMQAAVDAARETFMRKPLVVGVTVLTSLDNTDLASVGIPYQVGDYAQKLALVAQESGLDGVVCSPHEITRLRQAHGKDFTLVVPGIRPAGSAQGDQKRVMTPAEALAQGVDYLVIGRPITDALEPKAAAMAIQASLQ